MADITNPFGDKKTLSVELLPNFYKTDPNKRFLQATVDQLIQPGVVKKINGFIGRENSKATTSVDIFLKAATPDRQHYQLEPSITINDTLGNNTFFKDYIDYINQLTVFGANTSNHARINKEEFYSWDPHIDWDKFVNFQNYYWLPYGPDTIRIFGQQQAADSTFNIDLQPEGSNFQLVFTPDGLTPNPVIKLYRGQTYTFNINSLGVPISIRQKRSLDILDIYNVGVSRQSVDVGTIVFNVPLNAPNILYYQSDADINLGGAFQILSIEQDSYIDVESEILGKSSYKLSNGTQLSNGMKVSFGGNVTPASYATGEYYVEGVGSAIFLINKQILEVSSVYTVGESILFDSVPFDSSAFSDATAFARLKDYVTINRGSKDHNPWSRYNRWIHKDVITASALFNGHLPNIDQAARAVRPIIEFQSNLRLFNFGTTAIADIDLIDNFTTDVFSTVEGSQGYNVDGVLLSQGQKILFTGDTDKLVKNNIYQVQFVDVLHLNTGSRQLHLVKVAEPELNQVVLVRSGNANQGLMYWYNGVTWVKAQTKSATNQAPLFDLVDSSGVSFSNLSSYEGSTFAGTKIFSYKVASTGATDPYLSFPLTYKNINNIGDIVFNFNLVTDTFIYKEVTSIITKNANTGFLSHQTYTGDIEYLNGWQTSIATAVQAGIRIYKNSNMTNNFDIDIFDDISSLSDLQVKVFVNGVFLNSNLYSVEDKSQFKQVILDTPIALTDVLTIKTYASQPINSNGYYEIPLNLQNNPLNEGIVDFTLGEVIDHVNSIVYNLTNFVGSFPGASNLRDLGNVTNYGTKFVQHSAPASLNLYHITSQSNNAIRAIEQSRDDYIKFKKLFVSVAESISSNDSPRVQVDQILNIINLDKINSAPYYFSDMAPYGSSIETTITVIDSRIQNYPLNTVFNLDKLSPNAVGVYVNDVQLVYGQDYTFNDQGFVTIISTLANGDVISIFEYESTDGSFIPETPTKLGIFPKFVPYRYVDTTLLTPRMMIQGHDGSQVLAYNDYRDDIILELEKRIFNNIKVQYDTTIFDISDITPTYTRPNEYSLVEYNQVLAPNFYKWMALIDQDYTKNTSYSASNPFTYNYTGMSSPTGTDVPGYWRGVFEYFYDTDRPNLCPWEMLGLTIQPAWWTKVYGPAPYTSDNLVMWTDISKGLIKGDGTTPSVVNKKYIKSFLLNHIPVDQDGNLISPAESGVAIGPLTANTANDFRFGDIGPVEGAWRRSSHYPFSMLLTSMLLTPARTFGVLLDRSRIVRNLSNQLIYSPSGLTVKPSDIQLPSIASSTTRVQTAGIINYIVNYILNDNLKSYNSYAYDLNNTQAQISHRIGGFTSKEKFNLILDSKTPLSTGSVFVPQEDYDVILNTSSPIKKICYSGVVITKLSTGFEVRGYTRTQPYFVYYPYLQSGATVTVGGISEAYTTWSASQNYSAGKVVKFNNQYYRVKTAHTSGDVFEIAYFGLLGTLPIIGGKSAIFRKTWDRTSPITVPYGTQFTTIQDVVDFLLGYGEYLKDQGFIFDDFNPNLKVITNWETSAKEFLFWTTQNWSGGQEKWQDWAPNKGFSYNDIVRYNGDYYKAISNVVAGNTFQTSSFVKLDGLSTIGSSVLSLSPSADRIIFNTELSVVDDIGNQFNGYEIYKVDGTPLEAIFINSYRSDNAVSYSPRTGDGIYGATFYLIQHEHVVLLKNSTMFNDTIYNPPTGYKQDRIKVAGYISTDWYGGFDIPGFILDLAKITEWTTWTDYDLGDIVKHKEFYYTASKFLAGTSKFVDNDWIKLSSKPSTHLLPNWTYKASQFTDFYSLDSDNFDSGQQRVAQHLIGYQKRQYLDNIIQDDVSEYKFYQGMIREKGTRNVLNKLFDTLSADNKESLTFYEEWAIRVGQYGASNAFENIEFILNQSNFTNNPQGFELVNSIKYNVVNDFIIRQTPNDVYLKPVNYSSAPWPINKNYKTFLNSAGFVRGSDVFKSLKTLNDIVGIDPDTGAKYDITTFANNSYIHVSFANGSWDVYKFTDLKIAITQVTYAQGVLTFSTLDLSTLKAGQYIGISQVDVLKGFYKIDTVSLNSFTVLMPGFNLPSPFNQQGQLIIYGFISQKVDKLDNLDTVIESQPSTGEKIWVQDTGAGKWATLQFSQVYNSTEIPNTFPVDNLNFGKNVLISKNGTIAVTAMNTGEIRIWDKAGETSSWIERQTLLLPTELSDANAHSNLSTVLSISDDAKWLAIGSPLASNIPTKFKGIWNSSSSYDVGDIVQVSYTNYTPTYYEAILNASPGLIPANNLTTWKKVSYVPLNVNGTHSNLTEQGVVSLYQKDANNIFTLVDHIVSSESQSSEHFGSNIEFGTDSMFVSAPGYASQANHTGIIRRYNYATIVDAQSPYNPVGSSATNLKVTSTIGIAEGMYVVGTGFTDQYVVAVLNSTTVQLSFAPNSTPDGIIQFTTTRWVMDFVNVYLSPVGTTLFANKFNVSSDSSLLVVSGIVNNSNGVVYVYHSNATNALIQTITGGDIFFAVSLSLTDSGNYLAVGDIATTITKINQGSVSVYKFNTELGQFEIFQILTNHAAKSSGYFGTNLGFMNGEDTLVVYSQDEDTSQATIFDTKKTTFDKRSTNFTSTHFNSGRIDVYDRYANKWVYSETLETSNQQSDGYGLGFTVGANHILVGAPYSLDAGLKSGKIYDYYKQSGSISWNVLHYEIDKPDPTKIKKAFLYNKLTGNLIKYLDVIDISQGKIAGLAEEELKFKTFYDPATYSDSTGTKSVVTDSQQFWAKSRVGMLWWDLSTAKFIDSYDNDVVYRNTNWNTLATGASIDIYEWVESTLTPSVWDTRADTPAGLAANISGTSLYGDAAYSKISRYDTISQTTKHIYYFWVKNKKIVPNVPGRYLSADNVAILISNPRGYNYPYLALTGPNSFSLVNVGNDLNDVNVVLSVEYWTIDNLNQNIHSQYKLISTDPSTILPTSVEQKWIDSLCGNDMSGREVPDPTLQPKLKYGIQNRPRQSMFVNRFEALKELIDRTNITLKSIQIAENRNISNLKSYDKQPSTTTGSYDIIKTTEIDIPFINTGAFKNPILGSPTISNGKIIDIPIISAGRGYLFAPYITIVGTGINAKVRAVIDSAGQIVGVTIINPGEGYTSSTVASIRPFSVLIESDSQAEGFWSIYAYDISTKTWSRVQTQSYDVRNFWSYVDWYATGFNQFTAIDFSVDNYYGLNTISTTIGQTVKIRNANAGGWSLLEKYSNSESADWTQSYRVVGLQNGTIQFKSTLYQSLNTSLGYDGSIYDNVVYDNSPNIELRIILETLKNNILIDDLKQDYLNLFFTTIRYALSEQLYLDWIFKTSFVKSTHNVGLLDQPVTYRPDNLSNFQDYISEVVPYRTTVREYISAYSSTDYGHTLVTDFDVPPIFETQTNTVINSYVKNGVLIVDDSQIQSYPWKNWLDNVGFTVTSIKIVNGGSGYISEPVVSITSNSGSGATARAFFSSGVVNRIVLLTPGTGYLSAPTVTISGGLAVGGTPATATAIIGKSVVRSNLIKVKFDRTTYSYYVTQLAVSQTFTGRSAIVQFPLKWAPDIKIGSSSVTVDGIVILRDLYKLTTVRSTINGSTQYSGLITFTNAPATGATVIVNYNKDESLLNAADRIQYYYQSSNGNVGSDLAQLMTGIDYGGVIVDGLGFDVATGWGTLPYYSDKWDSADPTFNDYIVTVPADTYDFTLPYTPAPGVQLNFYYIQKNVDVGVSDGVNVVYPYALYDDNVTTTAEYDATSVVIQSNYTAPGGIYAPSTTLRVVSTTGIKPGMTVLGTGFSVDPAKHAPLQKVVRVVNSTTLILTSPPNIQPNGTLSFTFNIAGATVINLEDVSGINLGDTVSSSNVSAFGSETTVLAIDTINSTVTLNQIIFSTITVSDIVTFARKINPVYFNYTVILPAPVASGTRILVTGTLQPVRLDDPNFGNDLNTNPFAIMVSPIGDGTTVNYSIPDTISIYDGDKIIIRQSTSDGSVKPLEQDYDTALSGGNMAYTSATGIAPDEIIVDGDDFVSTTSSPAPEEVVPGQVVDALAIKVYDQPNSGSSNIKVDKYIADGVNKSFKITQTFNNPRAIIVKNNSTISTYSTDYTVDYKNKLINFNTAPVSGHLISIFSFGFNGSNVIDIDSFVGDGTTTEFLTKAPWLTHATSLVYVNGVAASIELFKTDSSYESSNRTGIRFGVAPAINAVINYVIVSGTQQTFSIAKTETIPVDGVHKTYTLSYPVGTKLPAETNMIVRVDQTILQNPINQYFTIGKNRLNYTMDKTRAVPYSIIISNILVYVSGVKLNLGTDYTIDLGGITVNITKQNYNLYKGQILTISVIQDDGYSYLPDTQQITFSNLYDSSNTVEVMSFYNHDILDIERTSISVTTNISYTQDSIEYFNYKDLGAGILVLDRAVLNDAYVWVMKNNNLLTPSIDYKVSDDKLSVILAIAPSLNDVYSLITYSSNILVPGISYMQFKDMLNRVHFKRLNKNKQTFLASDLHYNDIFIHVVDASHFDVPNPALNKPGVVEIYGERIEFYQISNNSLTQLRRGTQGTGTPKTHVAGTPVQDIGPAESLPYSESSLITTVISDGTNIVSLPFIPAKSDTTWSYDTGFTSTIPDGYGQCDQLEVFIAGYNEPIEWMPSVAYTVGVLIKVASYTYRCITTHTSSTDFLSDSANWQFFIGNLRLKKQPYKVHNETIHPYSPAGDVQLDAEFAVDGTSSSLRLTNLVPAGTQVTIVRRKGVSWDSTLNIQYDTNAIANFLKATPGIWYRDRVI